MKSDKVQWKDPEHRACGNITMDETTEDHKVHTHKHTQSQSTCRHVFERKPDNPKETILTHLHITYLNSKSLVIGNVQHDNFKGSKIFKVNSGLYILLCENCFPLQHFLCGLCVGCLYQDCEKQWSSSLWSKKK